MTPDSSADSFDPFLQDTYDPLPSNPNGHFQGYDFLSQGFNTNPQQTTTSFPSPPTPPGQNIYSSPVHQIQSHHHHSGNIGHKHDGFMDDPTAVRGGSDEDENMTPAQSRRKAQNRAA